MPRSTRVGLILAVLAAFAATACSARPGNRGPGGDPGLDPNNPELIPPTESPDGSVTPPPLDGESCNKMDILFVVDDSGSMMEEQANLASNFPKFISVLNDFRTNTDKALDYRIAVTTTGVDAVWTVNQGILGSNSTTLTGDNGAFRGGCDLTGNFISSSDASVLQSFSCVANVGVVGSPLEMPLRAIRLAVTDRVTDGKNKDFFRDDALLAIVVLTDEDDCSHMDYNVTQTIDPFSLEPPEACPSGGAMLTAQQVVDSLDTFKGDRSKWAVSIIAGPPGGSECMSNFGTAAPGNRLKEFTDAVGKNAVYSSICEGDLSGSLEDAVNTFNIACNDIVLY